jgi:hypothetical protein
MLGELLGMKVRKDCCPKCNYELLARKDNRIICLRGSECDWSIEAKRKDDDLITDIRKLRNG